LHVKFTQTLQPIVDHQYILMAVVLMVRHRPLRELARKPRPDVPHTMKLNGDLNEVPIEWHLSSTVPKSVVTFFALIGFLVASDSESARLYRRDYAIKYMDDAYQDPGRV